MALGSHIKIMRAWWYTTLLTSQLIRKQVGGFIFDVGLLGPCGKHADEAEDVASMPRTLQSMPRTLRSMPRRPRTLPSMPRRPRTLPSMPRSCQASLHILGSHLLGMLRNVLGMLAMSSASSACFPQGPRSPTSKIKPPTCFLISCETKGVVYHQALIF